MLLHISKQPQLYTLSYCQQTTTISMETLELTTHYLNELASQMLTISSLLGGFSIAIISNFLISDLDTKYSNRVLKVSILAASFFILSIFGASGMVLITTLFMCGIFSLILMLGMSGWMKSKKLGIYTTIVSALTFILTFIIIS